MSVSPLPLISLIDLRSSSALGLTNVYRKRCYAFSSD